MVFGHVGDHAGRRSTLLLSMAMMTAAMALTALLPTHHQIGAWAGGLLALRCIMGFSVGGEYTGVVAYLLEGAPPGRRGLIASWRRQPASWAGCWRWRSVLSPRP
jgi:MHS family proline/betaine transporter-like MFS transporter